MGRDPAAADRATAAPGDRGDDPAPGRDLADAVVRTVCNKNVARGVDGDSGRLPQLGAGGGPTVAAEGGIAGAGDRGDDPGPRRDLADAVICGVRDKEIARGVDGDASRVPQLGTGGGAPVAAEASITGAGDGGDDPGAERDPADAVVRGVRDEEVAAGVDGDMVREVQHRIGGGAAVADRPTPGHRGDDPARAPGV